MSRGLGRVQREILNYLPPYPDGGWADDDAGSWPAGCDESLRELAKWAGVPLLDRDEWFSPYEDVQEPLSPRGQRIITLRPARLEAVRRAVRSLRARGLVEVAYAGGYSPASYVRLARPWARDPAPNLDDEIDQRVIASWLGRHPGHYPGTPGSEANQFMLYAVARDAGLSIPDVAGAYERITGKAVPAEVVAGIIQQVKDWAKADGYDI